MQFIAFTTKGLEKITEGELRSQIPDAKIIETENKRITFESEVKIRELINLKTVDDLGLLIKRVTRFSNLIELINQIMETDLTPALNTIKTFRTIKNSFSLTVGVVGNNFKASDLIDNLAPKILQLHSWQFNEKDHTNFDIRIFIDYKATYLSIRLTQKPLQDRAYKLFAKPGSLKPTIAAAMVKLATKDRQDLKIIDNFCGSGTILCEALLAENQVFGGDTDLESIENTKKNLTNLSFNNLEQIKKQDATKTNWPGGYFDAAISNLPWDKQIEVKSITDLYINTLKEYFRIVKKGGVICLLVSKPELLIKHIKKLNPNVKIQTYPISLLGQNPTIVLVS